MNGGDAGQADLPAAGPAAVARYDGHAEWYDAWAQADGAAAMASAQVVLTELTPRGSGIAVDVGCGTGLHAAVIRDRGYHVVGLDYSADQLRLAQARIPVVRADARALPFGDGVVQVAVSVLTHTDVDDFGGLVREAVRVLAPGGCFVYVGVHPCFVSPVAERLPDGVRLHPGYGRAGWHARTPFTGNAVRSRVGVHHLPLQQLLSAACIPTPRWMPCWSAASRLFPTSWPSGCAADERDRSARTAPPALGLNTRGPRPEQSGGLASRPAAGAGAMVRLVG